MHRRIRFALFALTIASLYLCREARANGRFPEAQQIALAPRGGDEKLIALRTTFGIIVSRDAGATWSWICEAALGFNGEWDPPIAITKDGRIWVGLVDGLRSTRDGCQSEEITALHGDRVTDLAVDASGENLVVLTSPLDRPSGVSIVHADGAVDHIGGSFPAFQLVTVESASTGKLYVSGAPFGSGPRPHLFVANRGKDLVETPLDLPNDANVFVSAIDPKNEAHVVVRTLAPSGSDVLVSNDSGKTFAHTLHVGSLLYGFAKSDDGKTYFVGSGNPNDGIFRSDDRGATWTSVNKVRVRCLAARGDFLYACSTPYRPNGFAIASSRDGARTFSPLNSFTDIAGPIACDGGGGVACGVAWPAQRALLNPSATDAGAVTDASTIDAGASHVRDARSRACGCTAVGAEKTDLLDVWIWIGVVLISVVRMDRRRPS